MIDEQLLQPCNAEVKSNSCQAAQTAGDDGERKQALLFVRQAPDKPRQQTRPGTCDSLPKIQCAGDLVWKPLAINYKSDAVQTRYVPAP